MLETREEQGVILAPDLAQVQSKRTSGNGGWVGCFHEETSEDRGREVTCAELLPQASRVPAVSVHYLSPTSLLGKRRFALGDRVEV